MLFHVSFVDPQILKLIFKILEITCFRRPIFFLSLLYFSYGQDTALCFQDSEYTGHPKETVTREPESHCGRIPELDVYQPLPLRLPVK